MLLESPFDDAKKNWKHELQVYYDADPTTVDEELDSLISQFKKLRDANQLFGGEKDISYWVNQSYGDFKSFIRASIEKYERKKSDKVARMKVANDAIKVFENDKVLVVVPKSHEAAQKYGAGSKWCLTYKEPTYWKNYVNDQGFTPYFILTKTDEGIGTKDIPEDDLRKIALLVYTNNTINNGEVWTADDSNRDLVHDDVVLPTRDEVSFWQLIFEYWGIPTDVMVTYLTRGMNKHITTEEE